MTCRTHLNDLQLQVVPHISQKLCAKTTQYATFFATNSFVCRCANALEGYPAWQMTVVMTRVLQKCQDAHSYKLHFSFVFLCVLHLAIRQCSRDRRTCSCARIRGVTLELCCTRLARGFLLGGVFGLEWHVHSCVAFVSFFFFFLHFFFFLFFIASAMDRAHWQKIMPLVRGHSTSEGQNKTACVDRGDVGEVGCGVAAYRPLATRLM